MSTPSWWCTQSLAIGVACGMGFLGQTAARAQDCNTNGVDDAADVLGGTSADCDTNGVPDECDPDCNSNAVVDACEVGDGAPDCNTNQTPDACDGDCNANELADVCDIDAATSEDCDANGVPDECQAPGQFWDNGPADGTDGLVNQIGGVSPAEVADDLVTTIDGQTIVFATFRQFENSNYYWDGSVLASTWADVEGVPSEVPFDQQWVSGPNVTRVLTGGGWGNYYEYALETTLQVPDPGRCWFTATPSSQSSTGQTFWLTSAVPSEFGTSYFRSEFFGYPTWTPTENVIGYDFDFVFTLTLAGGDCNTNSVTDICDIASGSAVDCDTNDHPDECDVFLADCNTNGAVDACDVAEGNSEDANGDGVPDECQVGDMNCDGLFNAGDVAVFVQALVDPSGYAGDYPGCNIANGDFNSDGVADGDDVALFVEGLIGP